MQVPEQDDKSESRRARFEAKFLADQIVGSQAEARVDEPVGSIGGDTDRIARSIGLTVPQWRIYSRRNRGVLHFP